MIKLNFVLSIVGIILDILGSLFVALGFFATKNNDLVDQASQYWGFNPKLFEALVEQRDKAILGFISIFIGSICQLFSSFVSPVITIAISERNCILFVGVASLVVLLILELISKKVINKNVNSKLVARYFESYNKSKEGMEKEPSEHLRQSSKERKGEIITELSKRLSIKRKRLSEEDFEELVIKKTKKYLKVDQ